MALGVNGNGQKKDPVLVVVQLSGGNDFLNTVIPFQNGHYYDARPLVHVPEKDALPFTDTLAFHPAAAPLRDLYQAGNVAIVQGIGYENSSRSHFRAMDIWHTCEPDKIATEGCWARRSATSTRAARTCSPGSASAAACRARWPRPVCR